MAHVNLNKAVGDNQCVTIRQAKDYLYISHNQSDALLQRLILSAQAIFEQYTDVSIMKRTHSAEVNLNSGMELRGGQVDSIDSVTYFDEDNILQTYDVTNLYVDNTGSRARLIVVDGAQLPTTNRPAIINYTAGVATDDKDCPVSIAEAVLSIVAFKHEHRGMDVEIPDDVRNQLARHRQVYFG